MGWVAALTLQMSPLPTRVSPTSIYPTGALTCPYYVYKALLALQRTLISGVPTLMETREKMKWQVRSAGCGWGYAVEGLPKQAQSLGSILGKAGQSVEKVEDDCPSHSFPGVSNS